MDDARTSVVIDTQKLKAHVGNPTPGEGYARALITTKQHPTLPLSIHNYVDRALKSSTVTDGYLVRACRALITEIDTGLVVSRSFSKFFNYHEKGAYKPTGKEHAVAVEEKLDGSLISLFFYANAWHFASRASFDSTHTQAAKRIMGTRYPEVLKSEEILDKERTYVFELIDPALPIQVRYSEEDLVLLAIIARDGSEPPPDFDWSSLPFSRPRPLPLRAPGSLDPKRLSKLNRLNEEGFVVKFWRTQDDRHPQRIKIKLEAYLHQLNLRNPPKLGNSPLHTATNHLRQPQPSSQGIPPRHLAPTPASIVKLYTMKRLNVPTFSSNSTSSRMQDAKESFLASLESMEDDYGGDDWLVLVERVWDRVAAIYALHEEEWSELLQKLGKEGYRQGISPWTLSATQKAASKKKSGSKSKQPARADPFPLRITRFDIDASWRPALLAWFISEDVRKLVEKVLEAVELPEDLKRDEVITISSPDWVDWRVGRKDLECDGTLKTDPS